MDFLIFRVCSMNFSQRMEGQVYGLGSLVCGPVTLVDTYLPQHWEIRKVYAGKEFIKLVVFTPAKPSIVNECTIEEGVRNDEQ
jgi:hypothetical protein